MTDKPQDDARTNGETPQGGETPSRDEVLSLLEDGMREAHEKVKSGRVYDAENEKVRQKWIRTLAYAAGQYRQLKKDEDLEELDERLAALEEQQEDEVRL
jgi:flagellar motility protein MotE (MotC chaperone)